MVSAEKVKEQYLSDKHFHYHESQFKEPKRSTIALCNFVSKILSAKKESYKAVDICCGGGGNIYHLSKALPGSTWVGVDFADKFFSIARKHLPDETKYKFTKGDLYKLKEAFPAKSFDIAFLIQTATWLPGYESAVKKIMGIAKKWIFITSLFSDFKVDVFAEVVEYKDDWSAMEDSPYNYNIYSLGKFKEFCLRNGAKEVIAEDFNIDIDLPIPENKVMGTYTIKSGDGTRLQFSGAMFMPWKMIAVRLE